MRPLAGAQPVAVAADGQHVAVVQQTIENRGCDDTDRRYRAPFRDAAVRPDQYGTRLIASGHHLKNSNPPCRSLNRFQHKHV